MSPAVQKGSRATTALKGGNVNTVGELPAKADPAPEFTLTGTDLSDVTSAELSGSRVVLNIFPSLDTGVCAASVRRFNELAAGLANTKVVCVSNDLPFAQARFCGAEGIANVTVASAFRSDFGDSYGVTLVDGPVRGLLARAVVVLDVDGAVTYAQLVPEITTEPDYDGAVAALG
ncbi:MAG: thiol peroxidase [Actinomycetota bacterium]|nr:thiol peroxidase [Actinomycetota bacterium]